jgi:delta 1-pyrroline-5-carboxylate dehydrogenase
VGAAAATTTGAVVVLEPFGSESLIGTGPDIWLWTAPK